MGDHYLVAVIAGLPGLLAILWQIYQGWKRAPSERRRDALEAEAIEVGLLDPLHDEITQLRTDLDRERTTRQAENIAWAGRCAQLEARIYRLEDQVRSLGHDPVNGGP